MKHQKSASKIWRVIGRSCLAELVSQCNSRPRRVMISASCFGFEPKTVLWPDSLELLLNRVRNGFVKCGDQLKKSFFQLHKCVTVAGFENFRLRRRAKPATCLFIVFKGVRRVKFKRQAHHRHRSREKFSIDDS